MDDYYGKSSVSGTLEVGITPDGTEVIVNHPDLLPDENGCGHIVFSPAQARALAQLLLDKANECEPGHIWILIHNSSAVR